MNVEMIILEWLVLKFCNRFEVFWNMPPCIFGWVDNLYRKHDRLAGVIHLRKVIFNRKPRSLGWKYFGISSPNVTPYFMGRHEGNLRDFQHCFLREAVRLCLRTRAVLYAKRRDVLLSFLETNVTLLVFIINKTVYFWTKTNFCNKYFVV